MNKQTAKKLVSTAEGQALVAYIREKIDELDSLQEVRNFFDPQELVAEVKGRINASHKLREIFHTLFDASDETPAGRDPEEYVV